MLAAARRKASGPLAMVVALNRLLECFCGQQSMAVQGAGRWAGSESLSGVIGREALPTLLPRSPVA